MKERPILFSAPMVRTLLAGTKTQTRRIFKIKNDGVWPNANDRPGMEQILRGCPYGQPGDRLWVRETWNWFDPEEIPADRIGPRAPFTGIAGGFRAIRWAAVFAADGALPYPGYGGRDHWRPSIHMPRWASRITLEVVGVRVERLQDISESDAIAEGIDQEAVAAFQRAGVDRPAGFAYRDLWEQINGLGSWDANPWVWVIEFKRVEQGGAA